MPTTHDHLEKCDKLAIMGGTFDPIHNGHLAVADAVWAEFSPKRVLFMPGGQPPHKPDISVSCGEHRYNMTMLATCENPNFDVSRMEIDRKGPSYTVDTLEALREICPKRAEIYFIIGADALMEILEWHGAERLLKLCQLIAVCRPGYEMDKEYVKTLRLQYCATIHIFEGPSLEISGTALRKNFVEGKPVGGLMPKVVENYARGHKLYQTPGTDLTEERFEAAKIRLEARLSAKRFRHTMGTVIEAEKLAKHYGADVTKARWAALLHDCAKEYSSDKKRALCNAWCIELDEVMTKHIDITHSILGAESALRDFQVDDPEILQAIYYHTTGHANMTLMDKIITLSDYIEPNREACSIVKKQRQKAYTDINKAVLIGMKETNEDLIKRGRTVHPWSEAALQLLKKE